MLHLMPSCSSEHSWYKDTQTHCLRPLATRLVREADKFVVEIGYRSQPGIPQLASSLAAFAVRTRCST